MPMSNSSRTTTIRVACSLGTHCVRWPRGRVSRSTRWSVNSPARERQRTMGDADRERGLRVDEAALLAAAAGQVGDLIKKDEEEREGR